MHIIELGRSLDRLFVLFAFLLYNLDMIAKIVKGDFQQLSAFGAIVADLGIGLPSDSIMSADRASGAIRIVLHGCSPFFVFDIYKPVPGVDREHPRILPAYGGLRTGCVVSISYDFTGIALIDSYSEFSLIC